MNRGWGFTSPEGQAAIVGIDLIARNLPAQDASQKSCCLRPDQREPSGKAMAPGLGGEDGTGGEPVEGPWLVGSCWHAAAAPPCRGIGKPPRDRGKWTSPRFCRGFRWLGLADTPAGKMRSGSRAALRNSALRVPLTRVNVTAWRQRSCARKGAASTFPIALGPAAGVASWRRSGTRWGLEAGRNGPLDGSLPARARGWIALALAARPAAPGPCGARLPMGPKRCWSRV